MLYAEIYSTWSNDLWAQLRTAWGDTLQFKMDAEAKEAARDAQKSVAICENGGKIEMNRRNKNPGAVGVLPERMSKKHIRNVAAEFGVEYVQNNRAYLERLACEAGGVFIAKLKEKGAL